MIQLNLTPLTFEAFYANALDHSRNCSTVTVTPPQTEKDDRPLRWRRLIGKRLPNLVTNKRPCADRKHASRSGLPLDLHRQQTIAIEAGRIAQRDANARAKDVGARNSTTERVIRIVGFVVAELIVLRESRIDTQKGELESRIDILSELGCPSAE